MPKQEKTPEQKLEELRTKAGLGAEMAQLSENPIIKEWFEQKEKIYTQEMLRAEIKDDDTRREAACYVKVLRQLRQHMRAIAHLGKKAEADQAKLADKTTTG